MTTQPIFTEIDFFEMYGLPQDTPSYNCTVEINASQLDAELRAAGATNSLITLGNPELPISADNPAKIYVVGGTKIQAVLSAHLADPKYGMTDGQKDDFDAIAKVNNTPTDDLTMDDMAAALRAYTNPAPSPAVEVTE